jgi:hypothetical protein
MYLSPYSEAASRSATREFPNILRNSKVHYHVHKSLQLFLSIKDLFYYYPPTYVSVFLVVSLLLAFTPKPYTTFSYPHSCYITCNVFLLDLIILIILGEKYKLRS